MRYYDNSGRKKRLIIAAILGIFCIGFIIYNIYISDSGISKNRATMGYTTYSEKEYNEYLKAQSSDIDGMTKYDKADEGLMITDGSDSDGGLTI